MIESITFITSHKQKAEQLSWYLNFPVDHHKVDLVEIQSLDPDMVASHKSLEAYNILQKPVLVEDISICFLALGRLPGTYIKDFLKELGPEGLCKLLNGYNDRRAIVRPTFVLNTGSELKIFSAEMLGKITNEPRGNAGFGTDNIFMPDGSQKTWGEMNEEEQKQTSVRKLALEKLQKYLDEVNGV